MALTTLLEIGKTLPEDEYSRQVGGRVSETQHMPAVTQHLLLAFAPGAHPLLLLVLLRHHLSPPTPLLLPQVVPILTKLFASSDRGIRRGLLENIATYGPALPDKVVEEQVGRCGVGGGGGERQGRWAGGQGRWAGGQRPMGRRAGPMGLAAHNLHAFSLRLPSRCLPAPTHPLSRPHTDATRERCRCTPTCLRGSPTPTPTCGS